MTHADRKSDPASQRQERTVPLSDLAVARENLRHGEPADDDIPTLAATIRAAGVLSRLTVRPGRGRREAAWMVLDGRRRLLALAHLLDAGDIDADYPVPVVIETDPARQAAAALLTNTAAPVHVADVIAAIGRMLRTRLAVCAIAQALGYGETEVRRLAALSGLAPAALTALKAGRITLKQARLLARLSDTDEQAELAQAALDGYGFPDWRIVERLDAGQVTALDRRCALVDPETYAAAGGRSEADLFGERPAVLLDPELLTNLWTERVRRVAAVFEAEGIATHVAAGPEPELPDDLEPLGSVYASALPPADLDLYRSQREILGERCDAVRALLAEGAPPDRADLALIEMIRARIALDQTGCGGRVVTALALWPSAGTGLETRCYTPVEPETEDGTASGEGAIERLQGPPAYAAPEVHAPEPEVDGVNHALHAVRTDVATRGLIRALADDPGAALTALIARLFSVLVLDLNVARSDSALAILATPFHPVKGRVIAPLDGEVRDRLAVHRADWQASGRTVIAWVHGLAHGEKMGLLAELTAISLDVREERKTLIRRRARAEAAELAALCQVDVAVHWTPDAAFLQAHSKAQLLAMLDAMGAPDQRATALKKTELVDWVAEQAAARGWSPPSLSWAAAPQVEKPTGAGEGEADVDPQDGAGAFAITPAGQAALATLAA